MATAAAIPLECVIERSMPPALTRLAQAAVRPVRLTPGFGRPTISISRHVNGTPKPSALPTASLPANRAAKCWAGLAETGSTPARLREHPLDEAGMANQRPRHPLDFDQVDSNPHAGPYYAKPMTRRYR